MMASWAAASVVKVAVSKLIDSLLQTATGHISKSAAAQVGAAFKRWQTQKGLSQLHERSKQVRKVKTLWQVEREVDLLKFYYPSKITYSGSAPREVHRIADFPYDGNLVIRGTVGQGKSIFLRYLSARELSLGERIPVFVELRRLQDSQSLVEQVVDELKNLGLFQADLEVFEVLAGSGRLALLLDGFDEVSEYRVSRLVHELESLAVRWPMLRLLVTSRPASALEHSSRFRIVALAPLAPGEYAKLIERIAHDANLATEIVSGINHGPPSIGQLLTTPLMVSLLVVHYRVGQGIPENRVAFYEPIFLVLLQRHDKAKAGFVRPRHSQLSDSELRSFFNGLCFLTRRRGVNIMKDHELMGFAAKALSWLQLKCKADDAVDDITRITCLLIQDGAEYRFLHKSIQEFHAACLVRDQPESVVVDFYTSLRERWTDWQQELVFLETIDTYRFNRYFALPLLEHVVSMLPDASVGELGRALIGRLMIHVTRTPHAEVQHRYPPDQVGWCLTKHFNGSSELLACIKDAAAALATSRAERATASCEMTVQDLLPQIGHDASLLNAAEDLGTRVRATLKARRDTVDAVEERKGLFEL